MIVMIDPPADGAGRIRQVHELDLVYALSSLKTCVQGLDLAAYRRQTAKYHPDKAQHLGEEFQQLAEKRFKEIQQTDEQLIST